MNAELRIKLKKVDNTLRKFGYALEPYPKTLFLNKLNEFDDEGISSYIHLYMHKIPMDNGLYRLIFTAEPCRIPGGYDYMELDLAESISPISLCVSFEYVAVHPFNPSTVTDLTISLL